MVKFLTDCLGSRYLKLLAVGAIVVVLGLLAWGVAPQLILSALPLFPFMEMRITALCRHPSSIRDDDR